MLYTEQHRTIIKVKISFVNNMDRYEKGNVETSEFIESCQCSWILAASAIARCLLNGRRTRLTTVQWRNNHWPSALSNTRTAPNIAIAPLLPRSHLTVDRCNDRQHATVVLALYKVTMRRTSNIIFWDICCFSLLMSSLKGVLIC